MQLMKEVPEWAKFFSRSFRKATFASGERRWPSQRGCQDSVGLLSTWATEASMRWREFRAR
eukprot:14686898-Heterocapsa_arctica.AAC.1